MPLESLSSDAQAEIKPILSFQQPANVVSHVGLRNADLGEGSGLGYMWLFNNGDDAFNREAIIPEVSGILDLASPFELSMLWSKRDGTIIGVENPRSGFMHRRR
jgi:hypothetical protein